jgi:hypothetical protein
MTTIIPLEGTCINDQRRVFSTLPDPFKVRFSWTDTDKRASSIVVEYKNLPPEVKTKKSYEEEIGNGAEASTFCFFSSLLFASSLLLFGSLANSCSTNHFPQTSVVIWCQCDDTISEERAWIGGYLNRKEQRLEITNKAASQTCWLKRDNLRKMAWQAAVKGNVEVNVESLSWKSSDGIYNISSNLLIDPQEKHAYGLTVSIKTKTSFVSKSFLIPSF